jgi:hypothetical protein
VVVASEFEVILEVLGV